MKRCKDCVWDGNVNNFKCGDCKRYGIPHPELCGDHYKRKFWKFWIKEQSNE